MIWKQSKNRDWTSRCSVYRPSLNPLRPSLHPHPSLGQKLLDIIISDLNFNLSLTSKSHSCLGFCVEWHLDYLHKSCLLILSWKPSLLYSIIILLSTFSLQRLSFDISFHCCFYSYSLYEVIIDVNMFLDNQVCKAQNK